MRRWPIDPRGRAGPWVGMQPQGKSERTQAGGRGVVAARSGRRAPKSGCSRGLVRGERRPSECGHERARAATSQAPAQGRQGLPVGGPRQRDRDRVARGGAGGDGRPAARPRLDRDGAQPDPDPAATTADAGGGGRGVPRHAAAGDPDGLRDRHRSGVPRRGCLSPRLVAGRACRPRGRRARQPAAAAAVGPSARPPPGHVPGRAGPDPPVRRRLRLGPRARARRAASGSSGRSANASSRRCGTC